MHFMLFIDRSSHASKCLSLLTTITTTTVTNITILLILLFFTSVRARAIGSEEPIHHSEELLFVEEFKRRILEHMGLSSPPSFSEEFVNITRLRETYSNEIRAFLQRMEYDGNHQNHKHFQDQSTPNVSSKNITLQLKSYVQSLEIPIVKDGKHSSISETVRFSTPSPLELGLPYTKFILESAILRMRIKQHKYHLRRHTTSSKSQINIKVSLLHPNSSRVNRTQRSTLLKSFIVNPYRKSYVIELGDVKHHLASIFPSDYYRDDIVFQISATEIPNSELNFLRYRVGSDTTSEINNHNRHNKKKSKTRHRSTRSYISVSPKIEVKFAQRDIQKSRSRRSSNRGCSSSGLCCRHSIYINFADIGWDSWVLSPEGYTAYYCKGGCPKRYKPAGTFSGIKALLHEKNPNMMPAPTCSASGYGSIDLFHLDGEDGAPVETSFPDMTVTGCKCY